MIVSTGLRDAVTPAPLRAVVAHELAHLTGRHGSVQSIAELNASMLPGMRGPRALRRATMLLIELIADDTAARRTGAVHLANALSRISDHEDDLGMALRAELLATRRWTPSTHLPPVPTVYERAYALGI